MVEETPSSHKDVARGSGAILCQGSNHPLTPLSGPKLARFGRNRSVDPEPTMERHLSSRQEPERVPGKEWREARDPPRAHCGSPLRL